MGSASSMDSLYVEEVAASLVREFLSRKVMSGHSEAHEYPLMLRGNQFHQHLCTFEGGGAFYAFCSPQRFPQERPFPGTGKLHFPEARPS